MSWEELILEGLRSEKNLSSVVEMAAAAAPEEIREILKDFPESVISFNSNCRRNKGDLILQLLHFHLISADGQNFRKFPTEEQKTILENAAEASIVAAGIAFTLGEKKLGIHYEMWAGKALQTLRKFAQAEDLYKKALQDCQELTTSDTSTFDVAAIVANLGALYWNMGDFPKAEEAYIKARDLYRALERTDAELPMPNVAALLNNLGILFFDRGHFALAEETLKETLTYYRALGKMDAETYSSDIAMVLTTLGALYGNAKAFAQAEEALTEALTIRRGLAQKASEYLVDVAFTLVNLGNLYCDIGTFSQAEEALTEALTIRRGLAQADPDTYTPDVALTLTNVGLFYSDTGRYSEAEKALNEALTYYSQLAAASPSYSPAYAAVLTDLGVVFWNCSKALEAEEYYKKALEEYRTLERTDPESYAPYVAALLNNLGNIYWTAKNYQGAEECYKEALKTYRTLARKDPDVYAPSIAGVSHNLGTLYIDRGDFSQAEKAFEIAVAIREEKALWMELAETYHHLSRLESEKIKDAIKILELGILFSEEERYKYAQKGKKEEIYFDYIEKTDNPQNVYGILETLRDSDLLSLEWDVKDIEKVRNDINLQKRTVAKLLKKEALPRELCLHPSDDTVILYIQIVKGSTLYLAVTREGMHVVRSTSEFVDFGKKVLLNLCVQMVGEKFGGDTRDISARFDQLAGEWTQKLPSQIRELLCEKDTIVFSPDSVVSYFPLEGLSFCGNPICLSKKVVRTTSMQQLQETMSRKLIVDSSLLIGNPWPSTDADYIRYVYPSRIEIAYLEDAENEAETLGEILPRSHPLLNTQATADTFLKELPNYSLIHFVGHGLLGRILFFSGPMRKNFPEFEPEEFSKFRKAWRSVNGNTVYMMDEWDMVTDIDIRNTPLRKGCLVFLGACETGQHKYAGGGHFQGLAQAFLKSGASNVISSLIPLCGPSARTFVKSFYNTLLSQKSVSMALLHARKEMRQKYRAPVTWLPFIHYGSPD